MYRAYYGMANGGSIAQNSKGLYTNAIYGFVRMMSSLTKSNYDAILVAFDAGKKTIRHEWMKDYKAGRPPMPDEFRMQIAYIKEYLDIMRIKRYEQDLYEADDIIGTMSLRAKKLGYHVDIYSSDKDLLQLIDDDVTVHLTKKGMTDLEDYTPKTFFERYQIEYTQFIDLKALMGDKSDNLPGIAGIGEKKAVKYLQKYQTLDGIIANKDEITGSDGEKIRAGYENAILCRKMATIIRDFDINIEVSDLEKKDYNKEKLVAFYNELEFKSLLREITLDKKIEISEGAYKVIDNNTELEDILINDSLLIFETYEYNYHKSPLLGIGIKNEKGTFIIKPNLLMNNLILATYLSDNNMKKSVYDYKRSYVISKRYGMDFNGVVFDLLLATYVLNPNAAKTEFKGVCDFYGYDDVLYNEEVYGKGAKMAIPNENIIFEHIYKKLNALAYLKPESIQRLNDNNQMNLLTEIEIPLSKVLGKMEFNGMLIDINELENQEKDLISDISEIEKKIFEIAKKEFNVSSPKQLGTVLFEDLGIPYPKKKGNSYSTDIEILEAIRNYHPIVELVIDYRAKSKLYSTYVSGLRDMIYPDGKVHTIYEQALTQTGRLSSIEPNLQNIPIRTEAGHKIRKMFIPEKEGNVLYSADYSQIELRVLAHMAHVKKLIDAFNNGEDIHAKTAKEVFNKTEITPEDRRKAKAVNFGIVYGISAFGLAQDIGITNSMASEFMKKYYEAYPEIKEFMDKTIEFAKANGYVSTMKNRKRFIPDINSSIYMQREFAKRTAMNSPIQGSAADIIKIAMVDVDKKITEAGLKSKMLVQVHDELVFEVEKGEEEALQRIVKDAMENAVKLDIPLIVDDSFGKNWYEVK